MKLKNSKAMLASLLLAIGLSSSCSLVGYRSGVVIDIPARPEACPIEPDIEGEVTSDGKNVILALQSAVALRDYIIAEQACEARMLGHIEKLENRLKALK